MQPIARRGHLTDHLIVAQHARAWRHMNLERVAVLAVPVAPFALAARPRLVVHGMTKPAQVDDLVVCNHHNVATAPAVAPIGATLGRVGLTAKREASVPPAPGFDVDLGAVGEAQLAGASTGCTNTRRPLLPLVNSTRPETVAKMV